ncbi:T9SS type A sorting domain-containing protein [Flavobacterium sp.]|uniref:T9SS type A sorting domain-containing protein n=1 Tax=Flavobacterium sp. TaxID=239 RepID=UPI0025D75B73|nr:T9SS type A sorting domain-containing protein [Flavobacterium sp.]
MKKILLSVLTITAFAVNAQNIFQETFASYNAGMQLSGQGTWTNQGPAGLGSCSGILCSSLVTTTPISYFGYGSSAKSVELKNDSDSNGTLFTSVTSSDVYVGIVINVSSASGSPQDCFRVSTGAFAASFRLYIRAAGGGTFNVGAIKGSSVTPTYATGAYNYNQNHLIIFKYSIFSGTNDDVLNVYVDPTYGAGEPMTPSLSTTSGTDQAGSIKSLAFRQNAASGTIPNGFAGLISVASTWAGLTLNLSNNEFNKNTFTIACNQVNNGVINIKSNVSLDNASLIIYDIQGRKVESKTISLQETVNDVAINPIKNIGVYIVEILSSTNQRFTQKIVVN